MQQYKAIIIGTGQAGVPLAQKLNSAGWKTAVIEKAAPGGTCVNTGCMPTKAYVASAQRASDARSAEALGVNTGEVSVDLKKIWQRKQDFRSESRDNIRGMLEDAKHIDYIEGHARFTGNKTLEVNGEELAGEYIFINVGARARVPEPLSGHDFMTNVEILDLKEIPEHLIIVGGSYIGLEFGQIFRRFGSEVTIVERNERVIDQEDECISEAIQQCLEKEGIDFRLGAECISGRREEGKVIIGLSCDEDNEVTGSHVLLAVGRQPNTDDLGLEKTGIEVNDAGHIQVNDFLETSCKGVYALGDCNGEGSFTHTSYNDFQIIEDRLFGSGNRSLNHRILAYGLFIEPALGRVGKTEAQARKDAESEDSLTNKVAVFEIDMKKVARAKHQNKADGLLRIVVDEDSKEVLGAAFFGLHGDEMINGIADVMYAGGRYTDIRDAMHIHPTVGEMIPTMLE
ncbi:mercuric reductase [Lewinellaceae bacterium SD302]|nr:mercuric reductase [Lewinellaceae bacterium SD302]